MKIRNGFVSNSSSSSFICDACGEAQSGWDMCLEEAGMVECENGHTFCECHIPNFDEDVVRQAYIDKKLADPNCKYTKEELEDWAADEWRYYIPTEICPICTLTVVTNDQALAYLLLQYGKTFDEVAQEMRAARNS